MLLLLSLIVGNSAWADDSWVKTNPSDLATGDIVVIVDQTSSRAMSNDKGTSNPPVATEITLNADKSKISSVVAATLQWEVTVTTENNVTSYQFGVTSGETTDYLYCTNTNNGVRVGTNSNNVFIIKVADANNTNDYLYNTGTSRYIGVYNNSDWRCYTTVNNNIKETLFAFYKKVEEVSASPLASIALSGEYPTSFFVGDAFSTEGMTVTATYEDNSTKDVTSKAQFSGYDMATVSSSQTVIVSYTEGEVTKTASYQIEVKAIPTHTVTFSVNGTTTTQDFEEGATITFPENPADVESKTFVGWVTEAITGTTDEAPTFVTSATMGNTDITYYAVFATVEEGGNALSKMQAGDTFAAGDMIVVVASTDNGLFGLYQETISNSYVKNYTFEENYSTIVADDKNWWTVNSGSNGGWILGDATNGYLYTSGSNNLSVDKSSSSVWELEDNNDDTFRLKSGKYLSCRTDLAGDNANRFRLAGGTPAGVYDFTIYKLSSGISYSSFCTTVAADNRQEAGISFAEDAVTVELVDNYTGQVLSNPNSVSPVIWMSSNEAVATVENGTVTVLAVGETTITAKFDGDENYKKATVSYTLTVQDSRENPGFSFSASTAEALLGETFDAPTFSNPNNVAVTFESTDETVATIAQDGTVTILAAGTTTIKATSEANNTYIAGEASYTLTVIDPNVPGTENNPYTVAQARAAIDAGTGVTGVYAMGKVSAIVTVYNSQYENITFDISSDGTDSSDYLRVYRCVGTASTDASDVKVGDEVVIYGNLTLYNASIYEFAQGCQLVSLTHPVVTTPSITVDPATVNEDADEHDGTLALDYVNLTITDMTDFEIQYYNAEGEETSDPDWIEVTVAEQDPEVGEGYVVSYYMIENDGEARTAYFKIYVMDDETNLVYSNLVTVTQAENVAPFVPATYTLATTITSGKHYIIANGDEENPKAMGSQNSNNRAAADVEFNSGVATVNSADVYEFVIQGPDANGNYTIYDETNSGYLYAASNSSNHLKNEAALDKNNNGKWSIEFDGEGVATIKAHGSNSHNWMRYNSSNDIFSCYSDGQQNIYLYEKDGEATPTETVTISPAKYATYCSENALDFSNTGLSAYIAKVAEDKVTFEPVTKVPAYTGVLLKADAAGDVTVNAASSVDKVTGNAFIGVTKQTTINETGIFVLMNGEKGVGFYKTTQPFTLKANSAYLPALGEGARTFIGFDNETTAIERIAAESMANGEVYNLQGQRVTKAQKGLYIMNGKKVLVK